jgi:ankyrin repeat protein
MRASREGHEDVVAFLLSADADTDFSAKVRHSLVNGTLHPLITVLSNLEQDDSTALHFACFGGHGHIVSKLLKHNAAKDAVTKDGLTPLMIASEYGHSAVLSALIKAGADIHRTDRVRVWYNVGVVVYLSWL